MNCSMRSRPLDRRGVAAAATGAAAAALLLALVATAGAKPGNDNRAPVLTGEAAKLTVGAGHKVAAHAYAVGVQVYRWDGTGWGFVGPQAVLYVGDGDEAVLGVHYAGPTWESVSGSRVAAGVVGRWLPESGAIPWLLLKATGSEGPGVFDGVTFIQRLNTTGGTAPGEPGESVGEVAEVPYAADYYFYRAH